MAASSKSTGYMESRDILHDRLEYMGVTDAVTMVGFEDCVIGVLERFGTNTISSVHLMAARRQAFS